MAKPKKDDEAQSQRFIETARELEADEDEAAFAAKLRRLTKAPPPKPKSKDD